MIENKTDVILILPFVNLFGESAIAIDLWKDSPRVVFLLTCLYLSIYITG